MENIQIRTCEICGFQTENGRVMSNHKRWQHIMPKGSDKYSSTCQKIKESSKKEEITKTCICEKCGKQFEQTHVQSQWSSGKGIRRFCSSKCAHSRVKTDETKQKIYESVVKYYISLGDTVNCRDKVCSVCGKSFHSKSNFCSRSCSMKNRCGNVNRMSLKYYRLECSFTFALNDYPNEFDFKLIEQHGWYSPVNSSKPNLHGVSKDHMVSVKWGWEHKIDPKIISHPANCKLILQSENSSSCDECSITYEELLERIEVWNKKYGELAEQ